MKDNKHQVKIKLLRELAIYLEGVKAGKGNLSPLGESHLNNLWEVIFDTMNKK